jgi:diguanylate cyclase (GGDEF)-like protein/PAS domain S-box-containing protein
MNWQVISFIVPYLLSAAICLATGVYAYRRRAVPGAIEFAALALLETEWTIGYIGQSLASTLASKLLWNNVQFFGAVLVPVAYVAFGAAYTGRRLRYRAQAIWLIRIGAAALLALIWTDGLHHLFRISPHLTPASPITQLVFTNGPTFNLYTAFAYFQIIVGTVMLAITYTTAPHIYRLQVGTILVGILIPWIASVVTWLEMVPFTLHDVTPLAFAFSNMVVAWALFRYGLFNIAPIAYNTLVENLEDGVIVIDSSLRIVDMNPASQGIFHLAMGAALGKPLLEALPELRSLYADLATDGAFQHEIEVPAGEGMKFYEVRISSLYDHRRWVSGRLILLRDITTRKLAENQLRLLAITDPLTGLYNRRYFFSLAEVEFKRAVESGGALSVILMDIDYFKNVNDRYGHLAGDQVLERMAGRSREALRKDDILARYGGEEFAVLLPRTGSEDASQVAERLRASVAQREPIPDVGSVEITASLGVASLDATAGLTFDQLLDRADQALYQAKHENRNRVCSWEN